jgi:Vanillate O-demethylase oxygenase C-terminal domain
VLDPTHTAFTHNTLMRGMSDKRQDVDIRLFAKDGMLQLEFTGERKQDGLISFSERNRTGSTTHILHPGIVEVVYWHDHKINLVTTVYFSPADENETRGFILLTTPFQYGLAHLKALLFVPMFKMIIRQDQEILAASHANWQQFGRQPNATSPHDYMRPNLEALLEGREPPVAQEPLHFTLRL